MFDVFFSTFLLLLTVCVCVCNEGPHYQTVYSLISSISLPHIRIFDDDVEDDDSV